MKKFSWCGNRNTVASFLIYIHHLGLYKLYSLLAFKHNLIRFFPSPSFILYTLKLFLFTLLHILIHISCNIILFYIANNQRNKLKLKKFIYSLIFILCLNVLGWVSELEGGEERRGTVAVILTNSRWVHDWILFISFHIVLFVEKRKLIEISLRLIII